MELKEKLKPKATPPFDPKLFLAKVGEGASIADYHKDDIVFSQGDKAGTTEDLPVSEPLTTRIYSAASNKELT